MENGAVMRVDVDLPPAMDISGKVTKTNERTGRQFFVWVSERFVSHPRWGGLAYLWHEGVEYQIPSVRILPPLDLGPTDPGQLVRRMEQWLEAHMGDERRRAMHGVQEADPSGAVDRAEEERWVGAHSLCESGSRGVVSGSQSSPAGGGEQDDEGR